MPDHFFVYPAYVSQGATRALGRRVPKSIAVPEVSIDDLVVAATHLGFTAAAEPDKQYPREVHTYAGRVRVTKKKGVSKTEFLRQVATELARRRSAEGRS
ncbi:MAG TPA: signal recognition particle subunit SRP19/SEC65 family protein [Thermoplasmata archaeon]|nr:signal recognition particle subunit SRP19/SEC65 family protein [Thermoplasmata archaeon]